MKHVTRLKWLATFDIEPLISGILRTGILLGVGLVLASVAVQWEQPRQAFLPSIQARSLPSLIVADLRHLHVLGVSRLLLDLGIGVLMLTPYARLLVSLMYAIWAERQWQHAFFTGFVLIMLTVLVLTDVM